MSQLAKLSVIEQNLCIRSCITCVNASCIIEILKFLSILCSTPFLVQSALGLFFFLVFPFFKSLEMDPKVRKKFKTKAKKTKTTTPLEFDTSRFKEPKFKETFKTMTKYRLISTERQVILDDLDPTICRNFESRSWLPICEVSHPPPAALIREFYSNLFIHSDDSDGHYLSTWIKGEEYDITGEVVADAHKVPIVRNPTYSYSDILL